MVFFKALEYADAAVCNRYTREISGRRVLSRDKAHTSRVLFAVGNDFSARVLCELICVIAQIASRGDALRHLGTNLGCITMRGGNHFDGHETAGCIPSGPRLRQFESNLFKEIDSLKIPADLVVIVILDEDSSFLRMPAIGYRQRSNDRTGRKERDLFEIERDLITIASS